MKQKICLLLFCLVMVFNLSAQKTKLQSKVYVCLPCGYDCDKEQHTAPGTCNSCHMRLVERKTIRYNKITADKVCRYIQQHPDVVLLDVRTPEEFAGKGNPDFGGLKGAINIPVQTIETDYKKIEQLKSKTILVFCSHSHRSPMASYILGEKGFSKVINMEGGMSVLKKGACKER